MEKITIPEYAKKAGVSRIAAFRQFKRLKEKNKELPGVTSHTQIGRTFILEYEGDKKTKK